MLSLVKRSSVVAQATESIRHNLTAEEWRLSMPGERVLALRLGVSRPTIRSALEILEREGLIQNTRGKRRVVIGSDQETAPTAESQVVGFITHDAAHSASALQLLRLDELRSSLHDLDFRLEVHSEAKLFTAHPERALEQLLQENPARCWLISVANQALQQWFADRQLPTLLLGSRFPGIDLPAMSLHHQAICRHAVGVFTRLGHRRIAFLIRDSGLAGDLESESGFLNAIKEGKLNPAECPVVRHDSTVSSIRRSLNAILESDAVPTALLVAIPGHTITAASHVMAEGFRIPADISIICRDDDYYLDHFALKIARYSFNASMYVRRLCRMVGRLIENNYLMHRQYHLLPDLKKGQTLGPPPPDL